MCSPSGQCRGGCIARIVEPHAYVLADDRLCRRALGLGCTGGPGGVSRAPARRRPPRLARRLGSRQRDSARAIARLHDAGNHSRAGGGHLPLARAVRRRSRFEAHRADRVFQRTPHVADPWRAAQLDNRRSARWQDSRHAGIQGLAGDGACRHPDRAGRSRAASDVRALSRQSGRATAEPLQPGDQPATDRADDGCRGDRLWKSCTLRASFASTTPGMHRPL